MQRGEDSVLGLSDVGCGGGPQIDLIMKRGLDTQAWSLSQDLSCLLFSAQGQDGKGSSLPAKQDKLSK